MPASPTSTKSGASPDPDPAKVEAKFDKGVLHIHLPKPAEVAKKQQKIEIKKA
jgi:HSP20 family protein